MTKIVFPMQQKRILPHLINESHTVQLTLDQIIEGCREGNAEARRELYMQYGSAMYGVVKRYVNDTATAEDLLHDGFVTLFTRIGDYHGNGSFEGWCRRIFVNTVMSHFRRYNPLKEAADIEAAPLRAENIPSAIDELSAEEIKRCVDSLPEGYRTIFNMHAVDGYDYSEIADALGISTATTRSQYMRARMKLIDIIECRLRDRFPAGLEAYATTGSRRRK